MNKPHHRSKRGTYAEKAASRWSPLPDWIAMLAAEADKAPSLRKLGARLGISDAAISHAINNSYSANLDTIEKRVRGLLMSAEVACPVVGMLPTNRCVEYQRRKFSAASPMHAKLYFACKTCVHNSQGGHRGSE